MPVISKEDLLRLHDKIEKLETENKSITKFYTEKVQRINKQNDKLKNTSHIAFICLAIFILGGSLFYYFGVYKAEPKIVEKIVEKIVKVPYKKTENTDKPDFYYTVQIASFEGLEIPSAEMIRYELDGKNQYLMGNFKTYKDAKDFVRGIYEVGFKDAFVVALQKGKKLPIEEALKITDEEGMFLKYREKYKKQ